MYESGIFDAFGTLCEIKNRRSTYLPIIKAWPGGAANAYQTLMTRNCPPAELALEAGYSNEAIQKIEEGVAAEIESMRLYPEVLTVLNNLRHSGVKWAVVSNLVQPYAHLPVFKLWLR